MEKLLITVKDFLIRSIGSSVCLKSRDESLLKWTCEQVIREVTNEFLEFEAPGIDDIRYMSQFLYTSSSDGYKIVIIHRADRILHEAANSMLKILEEPPVYSEIVLTSARYTDLLPTIKSRVKVFNVAIDRQILNNLERKKASLVKPDLILSLAENDFEVLDFVMKSDQFPQNNDFDPKAICNIFSKEEISAADKVSAILMIDDLYEKLSLVSEETLVKFYDDMMSNLSRADLNRTIVHLCRLLQIVAEYRGCTELSLFKWIDSILTNRLMNFNGTLTLLNLFLVIRENAKR
ncbi:hypothetical protein [Pseudothermotoga elfii]